MSKSKEENNNPKDMRILSEKEYEAAISTINKANEALGILIKKNSDLEKENKLLREKYSSLQHPPPYRLG